MSESLSVFLSTFGVIFLAEFGDKTQLTAMALATRYPWRRVFVGLAAAFLVLNVLAVVVGRVLFEFVPHTWIGLVSGGLFVVFGLLTLRPGGDDDEDEDAEAAAPGREGAVGGSSRKRRGAVATAFGLIFLAELGDKTELVTASLAAERAAPIAVFLGSTLALWLVSLVGILVGKQVTRVVPMRVIHILAGVLFLGFGAWMLYGVLAPILRR